MGAQAGEQGEEKPQGDEGQTALHPSSCASGRRGSGRKPGGEPGLGRPLRQPALPAGLRDSASRHGGTGHSERHHRELSACGDRWEWCQAHGQLCGAWVTTNARPCVRGGWSGAGRLQKGDYELRSSAV